MTSCEARPLPERLDAKRLRTEMRVTRAAAEAIMRRCPNVQFEGFDRVYVRRSDVVRVLADSTFEVDQVVPELRRQRRRAD